MYVSATIATAMKMPAQSVSGTPPSIGSYRPAGITSGVNVSTESTTIAPQHKRQ